MRNVKAWIIAVVISISLALSACSETMLTESESVNSSPTDDYNTASHEEIEQCDSSSENTPSSTSDSQDSIPDNSDKISEVNELLQIPDIPQNAFSIDEISPYSGQPFIEINDNIPLFPESDLTTESFELYSNLDEYGRCGVAYACIGIDIMPTEERGEIGQIRPSGWHTVKYNDIIDGNYLYNRCHLIGYQLAGENTNKKNLITGTRYLNVQGMLPFENMVTDYVKETGNHVLYRVTPIFEGDNLLASGVLMEAESVEDKGDGISFCVYVYNVQPGIIIDYTSGESCLDEEIQAEESEIQTIGSVSEPQSTTYILNTNTMKFHYPSCSSVDEMKEKNKQVFTGIRDDVISQGYVPCKRCNP